MEETISIIEVTFIFDRDEMLVIQKINYIIAAIDGIKPTVY